MKVTVLGNEVEVTKENVNEIMSDLNQAYNKLYTFSSQFSECSRCNSIYDSNDENSQWTMDGRLCPDCHESYSIKHYCDGGVGVINNETGEPLPLSEIRWL